MSQAGRVQEWKVKVVKELVELLNEFPVVGVIDITEVPAKLFQEIRQKLGDEGRIVVAKNTLITRAIDAVSEKNPKLAELKKFITGQSALIFSRKNPFKLNAFFKENRVNAPAKVGSISSKDVLIPPGETDLPPGPVVAELQRVGLKARIQAGKVVILEECQLVKAGDTITKEISDTLAKFGILPVELRLRIKAAYENGVIFFGEILEFDQKKALEQTKLAWTSALNLALNIEYPTGATITLLLMEAHLRSLRLALKERLPVKEVMPHVLMEAHGYMLSLALVAGTKKRETLDPELAGMLGLTEEVKKEDVEEKKQEVKGGQQG